MPSAKALLPNEGTFWGSGGHLNHSRCDHSSCPSATCTWLSTLPTASGGGEGERPPGVHGASRARRGAVSHPPARTGFALGSAGAGGPARSCALTGGLDLYAEPRPPPPTGRASEPIAPASTTLEGGCPSVPGHTGRCPPERPLTQADALPPSPLPSSCPRSGSQPAPLEVRGKAGSGLRARVAHTWTRPSGGKRPLSTHDGCLPASRNLGQVFSLRFFLNRVKHSSKSSADAEPRGSLPSFGLQLERSGFTRGRRGEEQARTESALGGNDQVPGDVGASVREEAEARPIL